MSRIWSSSKAYRSGSKACTEPPKVTCMIIRINSLMPPKKKEYYIMSRTWSWFPGIMMTGCDHSLRLFKALFSNSTLKDPLTCQKSPRNMMPACSSKRVNTCTNKESGIFSRDAFRFSASKWTVFSTSSQVSMDELFTWRSENIIHLSQAAWAFGGFIWCTTLSAPGDCAISSTESRDCDCPFCERAISYILPL